MAIPSEFGGVEALIKRFKSAKTKYNLWRSLHQEAFDYAAPSRENFRAHSPGQRKNRHIFDSTAVNGLQQFANRIQAAIVPSWQQWIEYAPGDEIPEEEKDSIEKLLEESTKAFFSHINHSNFSTEITPALVDLGVGTGAIMVEEGEFTDSDILRFTNVPLSELYPETPVKGIIESTWRQQKIEVGQIKRLWPEAELTSELAKIAETKPQEEIDILNGMLFNPKQRNYHQIIIHEKTKSVLFDQAFNSKRLIPFRWHVQPGETFGRGPIMQVLPDIRTVNKVKQFMLENAAIQISGMYTGVDDGVFNPHTARVAPGIILPVASNQTNNPSLAALPRAGDIGLGAMNIEYLQLNINKALFSDPLGEVTDPVRSATETMIRQQENLKQSGASFGRLFSELVEPLVEAVTDILSSRGKLPQIRVDGREVSIKQVSPLAKSQSLDDFQNSQVWFSTVAQLPPEVVAASVKVEELPKYWQEKLGVPAALVRTEQEREEAANTIQQASLESIEGGEGEQGI